MRTERAPDVDWKTDRFHRKSPYDVRKFSTGKKIMRTNRSFLEIRTANGIVRSTKEATVYILELRTYLYVKLVEDSLSAWSLGRSCDELGYSNSWQAGPK